MLYEIHKYADWSQEVKNLYDAFPDAKIWFSGSSTLALQKVKGDLSRRIVTERKPGVLQKHGEHIWLVSADGLLALLNRPCFILTF